MHGLAPLAYDSSNMRYRIGTLSVLPALFLAVHGASAQSAKPEVRLTAARAMYYTPTTTGMESFSCKVSVDWKQVLTHLSGKDVQDDNPILKYFNSLQLNTRDKLRGEGSLDWSSADAPPQSIAAPVTQMRQGIQDMFSGFYKSWNAYLNGSMVPFPDKTTQLTAQQSGIHLHAATGAIMLDEDYDQNMVLTGVHVVMENQEVTANPTFTKTPDGLLVSQIRSEVHQPATAPPTYVNLGITYQPVGGYQIPATIHYDVKNVLQMDFNLNDCTVNTAAK